MNHPAECSLSIGSVAMTFALENASSLPGEIAHRYSAFLDAKAASIAQTIPLRASLTADSSLRWPGATFTPPQITTENSIVTMTRSDLHIMLDVSTTPYQVRGRVMDSVFSFDTVMRLLLAEVLMRHNGFLVHGCALDIGCGGALLHGVSGAGKSTLSKRAGLAATLTDELAIVRKIGAQWTVFGTPFWGEFRHAGQARALPLKLVAAFEPPQDRQHHAALAPAAALRYLARDVFCFNRDTAAGTNLLTLAADLATQIPQISFAFGCNESWESIRQRLQSCTS